MAKSKPANIIGENAPLSGKDMDMPEKDGPWDQHLQKLNSKQYSRKLRVSLVYLEEPFYDARKHTAHLHPYWQISAVLGKSYSVNLDNLTFTPKRGDLLLIPPGRWHYFDFSKGHNAWSIKFVVEGMSDRVPPGIVKNTRETRQLRNCLFSILKPEQEAAAEELALLEYLVAALIDVHFINMNIGGEEARLMNRTRTIIDEAIREGINIKVEEIAKQLGVSTTYITRITKQRLGIPLKGFVDQQRFDAIRNPLIIGQKNMSELADEFGFIDVFSFSRFIKRLSGFSPTDYRNRFS